MSDVEREDVQKTTWAGTISDAMVRDIVFLAVCKAADVNWWEKGLTCTLTTDADPNVLRFVLVKDQLWSQK